MSALLFTPPKMRAFHAGTWSTLTQAYPCIRQQCYRVDVCEITRTHYIHTCNAFALQNARRISAVTRLSPRARRLSPRVTRLSPRVSCLSPRVTRLSPRVLSDNTYERHEQSVNAIIHVVQRTLLLLSARNKLTSLFPILVFLHNRGDTRHQHVQKASCFYTTEVTPHRAVAC